MSDSGYGPWLWVKFLKPMVILIILLHLPDVIIHLICILQSMMVLLQMPLRPPTICACNLPNMVTELYMAKNNFETHTLLLLASLPQLKSQTTEKEINYDCLK
jgi:hypothetical protein